MKRLVGVGMVSNVAGNRNEVSLWNPCVTGSILYCGLYVFTGWS